MLAHVMDSPGGSMRRRPRLGPNPGPRCLLTLGGKNCYLCDPSWIGWTCPRCGVTWRAPAAERQPHGTASASTAPGVPLGPGDASSAAAPGAAGQPAEHSQEGVAAGEGSDTKSEAEDDRTAEFVPCWDADTDDMGAELAHTLGEEYTEAAREEARIAHAAADARGVHAGGGRCSRRRPYLRLGFRKPGDLHLEATAATGAQRLRGRPYMGTIQEAPGTASAAPSLPHSSTDLAALYAVDWAAVAPGTAGAFSY